MSNEILVLKQKFRKEVMGNVSSKLQVTAFCGGSDRGLAVQLSMDKDYFTLTEEQIRELIDVLQKRLNCVEGYCATD